MGLTFTEHHTAAKRAQEAAIKSSTPQPCEGDGMHFHFSGCHFSGGYCYPLQANPLNWWDKSITPMGRNWSNRLWRGLTRWTKQSHQEKGLHRVLVYWTSPDWGKWPLPPNMFFHSGPPTDKVLQVHLSTLGPRRPSSCRSQGRSWRSWPKRFKGRPHH